MYEINNWQQLKPGLKESLLEALEEGDIGPDDYIWQKPDGTYLICPDEDLCDQEDVTYEGVVSIYIQELP